MVFTLWLNMVTVTTTKKKPYLTICPGMCVTDSVGSHNAQPWQCAPMPWFYNKLWFSVRNIQKVCECRVVHLINSL